MKHGLVGRMRLKCTALLRVTGDDECDPAPRRSDALLPVGAVGLAPPCETRNHIEG
jgi:hypothetical protein